jgi:hypothetical protein
MEFEDIEKIVIIVQLKSGAAHQVLASKDDKETMLRVLSATNGKILLHKEMMPIVFEEKK